MVILKLTLIVFLPTSHQRRNGRPTQARDSQRLAEAELLDAVWIISLDFVPFVIFASFFKFCDLWVFFLFQINILFNS